MPEEERRSGRVFFPQRFRCDGQPALLRHLPHSQGPHHPSRHQGANASPPPLYYPLPLPCPSPPHPPPPSPPLLLTSSSSPAAAFQHFLTARGTIKLGDFGLSRPLATGPSTNSSGHSSGDLNDLLAKTTCGTPYYMSPEQVKAEAYSYPADVWAYACVMFEVITLNRPLAPSFPRSPMRS